MAETICNSGLCTVKQIGTFTPGDGHVFDVTRDVVISGQLDLTCTSCHEIHAGSTARHVALPWREQLCSICHENREDSTAISDWESHSDVCQY